MLIVLQCFEILGGREEVASESFQARRYQGTFWSSSRITSELYYILCISVLLSLHLTWSLLLRIKSQLRHTLLLKLWCFRLLFAANNELMVQSRIYCLECCQNIVSDSTKYVVLYFACYLLFWFIYDECSVFQCLFQAPFQPGSIECGFYVMRFMKDITEMHILSTTEKITNFDFYGV